MNPEEDLSAVAGNFQIGGEFNNVVPYGQGHINDTYLVNVQKTGGISCRYILQRINRTVFKKPEEVMHNIEQVTKYIRRKITVDGSDPSRKTLTIIPALGGTSFYKSDVGDYWRVYLFIDGARTYQTALGHHHYYSCGRLFGEFLSNIKDFPASELYETIPDFHHTSKRYQDFADSVDKDVVNRANSVKPEMEFIYGRESEINALRDLVRDGVIPKIVTHNDTKIDNVMIDDDSGEGVCVIDLDTVMPGISIYDFGDAVRSGANPALENEQDLSRVILDLDIFEHLARGFLESASAMLTPAEVDHLVFGTKLITLEQAIRFLTDFLNGDRYYKTHRPGHNLDRTRTQISLILEIEKKFELMQAVIEKYR